MFITVTASLVCVCVVVLPFIAELRRMYDDRHTPSRLLEIPTRRSQVQGRPRGR